MEQEFLTGDGWKGAGEWQERGGSGGVKRVMEGDKKKRELSMDERA